MKLFISFQFVLVVIFSNGIQGQNILFNFQSHDVDPKENNDPCRPLTQCQSLMKMMRFNAKGLSEFDLCGMDGDVPLYKCPDLHVEKSGDFCDCKTVNSCKFFDRIVQRKGFKELKNFTNCGFDDHRVPKYCCPISKKGPKRTTIEANGVKIIENNPKTVTTSVRTAFGDDENNNNVQENKEDFLDNCGVTLAGKIVGGSRAGDHSFPWAAALGYVDQSTENKLFLCGGTLISEKFVLTAAHCITSKGDHHLSIVRMGHSDLNNKDTIQDFNIDAILIHPDYESSPLLINDLALLRLENPVKFDKNNYINPVCLPKHDQEIISPEVIGWGLVNHTTSSDILQFLNLDIVNNEQCENVYQSRIQGFFIEETQICGAGKPGTDSCKGDSGGPLLFIDNDSKYRIIGITSYGTIKCDSSVPGVYTRVLSYKNWIIDSVRKYS